MILDRTVTSTIRSTSVYCISLYTIFFSKQLKLVFTFLREQTVFNDTLFPPISTIRLLIFLPDYSDPIICALSRMDQRYQDETLKRSTLRPVPIRNQLTALSLNSRLESSRVLPSVWLLVRTR